MTTQSAVAAGHTVESEPNTRVVVVRAAADGSIIARTSGGHVLHETGYPDRWYIPRGDVVAKLDASDTTSHCPFKGDSTYWSARLADGTVLTDAAWSYEDPRSDVLDTAHELSFWSDAVTVEVDGQTVPA